MRSLFLFGSLLVLLFAHTAQAKKAPHTPNKKYTKHLSRDQVEFFEFCSELILWTAKFAKKLKDPGEPATAIYPRLTKSEISDFSKFLARNRHTLSSLNDSPNIHQAFGVSLMPDKVFHFIREAFALGSLHDPIRADALKYHLMGGQFNFGNNGMQSIEGLYDLIKSDNLKLWLPIKEFLRKFRDTLSVDRYLSQSIGFTILPMIEHYFDYMDPINRMSLLREVIRGQKYSKAASKSTLLNELAIQVFQNSGPVFIKLLQQLQEELRGEGPLNKVLAGLKNSKPINPSIIEKRVKAHLGINALTFDQGLFSFRKKPLGIASIAQTHSFSFKQHHYVAKYRKTKIIEKFEREISSIHQMVAKESVFDKGMKQYIKHIEQGIREELDFNFERNYIERGRLAYHDESRGISSIENALEFSNRLHLPHRESPSDLLVMTFAKGKPLGDFMTQDKPHNLHAVYTGVMRLYSLFLESAFSPYVKENFYHGDLHRENIFYDEESQLVTVIDFGNAGILHTRIQNMLIKIFQYTEATSSQDEAKLDEAITNLSLSLRDFTLPQPSASMASSLNCHDVFFQVCFNPKATMPDKRHATRRLLQQKHELENRLPSCGHDELRQIRDQIDFINALTNNCLSGPKSTLLSTLASELSTSEKLKTVFQEMLKNGISTPRELIFFNKSKGLLEGILHNLEKQIMDLDPGANLMSADEVFLDLVRQLRETGN